MTTSNQDIKNIDLFGSLSGGVALDDPGTQVTTAEGTRKLQEDQRTWDRSAAVEAFAGWSTALDPAASEVRGQVLDLIEQWVPNASEAFSSGTFPDELFRNLGRVGALGASLVGRNGNPPLSKLATYAIMHAVEYGDGGLRCALTVHDSVIQALVRFGSDEQRDRWLDPLVRGNIVSAFALTEPTAGSDIRGISTKATRSGDVWHLSGSKSWITNGPRADVIMIWARTGERNNAIRGFLVEKGTPGLKIETINTASSMRIAPVGRVNLDQVPVPHSAMLPHAWGLTDINACLDYNRLTVLFGVMGGARRCLDIALEYAATRYQFGVPIASKQLVQTMLADMAERVAMGELACLHLAKRWEDGPLPRFDVSLTKRHNCAAALEVARMARSILGANGVDLDRHIMRHLLNLEASYSYGGTHEIHGLIIGKELTRENAF
ncbi:MAG: acyl-CoA dehydrogenase family protein [Anaerolineales bacterium]|nr:acyl-CoA dehydrogenase family protein [Anaerolineales bacterium]